MNFLRQKRKKPTIVALVLAFLVSVMGFLVESHYDVKVNAEIHGPRNGPSL